MTNLTKKLLPTILLALVLSSAVPAQAATKARPTTSSEENSIENTLALKTNYALQNLRRSTSTNIAVYQSWAFYGNSQTEIVCLQMDADTISLVGYCEGNVVDNLTAYIWSIDNSNFNLEIPFDADGNATTYGYSVPAGEYKVKFTGTSTIKKTDALCVFTVVD